eukprot:CAMPEP_0172589166 /NCGR_PEP_ID=MMETSP1068-20121228/7964_1 /TAXON_ID=35684 /ORGANISM="Pseudopedinella elastica, Strain CCMP716" /LENGTH=43 /DNA_ID= /DNA_START= /DNA_END= /DNA_ORIENTATION=
MSPGLMAATQSPRSGAGFFTGYLGAPKTMALNFHVPGGGARGS